MVDVSIVNETPPEANWKRQTGRRTGRQANLCVGRLRLQKPLTYVAAPLSRIEIHFHRLPAILAHSHHRR